MNKNITLLNKTLNTLSIFDLIKLAEEETQIAIPGFEKLVDNTSKKSFKEYKGNFDLSDYDIEYLDHLQDLIKEKYPNKNWEEIYKELYDDFLKNSEGYYGYTPIELSNAISQKLLKYLQQFPELKHQPQFLQEHLPFKNFPPPLKVNITPDVEERRVDLFRKIQKIKKELLKSDKYSDIKSFDAKRSVRLEFLTEVKNKLEEEYGININEVIENDKENSLFFKELFQPSNDYSLGSTLSTDDDINNFYNYRNSFIYDKTKEEIEFKIEKYKKLYLSYKSKLDLATQTDFSFIKKEPYIPKYPNQINSIADVAVEFINSSKFLLKQKCIANFSAIPFKSNYANDLFNQHISRSLEHSIGEISRYNQENYKEEDYSYLDSVISKLEIKEKQIEIFLNNIKSYKSILNSIDKQITISSFNLSDIIDKKDIIFLEKKRPDLLKSIYANIILDYYSTAGDATLLDDYFYKEAKKINQPLDGEYQINISTSLGDLIFNVKKIKDIKNKFIKLISYSISNFRDRLHSIAINEVSEKMASEIEFDFGNNYFNTSLLNVESIYLDKENRFDLIIKFINNYNGKYNIKSFLNVINSISKNPNYGNAYLRLKINSIHVDLHSIRTSLKSVISAYVNNQYFRIKSKDNEDFYFKLKEKIYENCNNVFLDLIAVSLLKSLSAIKINNRYDMSDNLGRIKLSSENWLNFCETLPELKKTLLFSNVNEPEKLLILIKQKLEDRVALLVKTKITIEERYNLAESLSDLSSNLHVLNSGGFLKLPELTIEILNNLKNINIKITELENKYGKSYFENYYEIAGNGILIPGMIIKYDNKIGTILFKEGHEINSPYGDSYYFSVKFEDETELSFSNKSIPLFDFIKPTKKEYIDYILSNQLQLNKSESYVMRYLAFKDYADKFCNYFNIKNDLPKDQYKHRIDIIKTERLYDAFDAFQNNLSKNIFLNDDVGSEYTQGALNDLEKISNIASFSQKTADVAKIARGIGYKDIVSLYDKLFDGVDGVSKKEFIQATTRYLAGNFSKEKIIIDDEIMSMFLKSLHILNDQSPRDIFIKKLLNKFNIKDTKKIIAIIINLFNPDSGRGNFSEEDLHKAIDYIDESDGSRLDMTALSSRLKQIAIFIHINSGLKPNFIKNIILSKNFYSETKISKEFIQTVSDFYMLGGAASLKNPSTEYGKIFSKLIEIGVISDQKKAIKIINSFSRLAANNDGIRPDIGLKPKLMQIENLIDDYNKRYSDYYSLEQGEKLIDINKIPDYENLSLEDKINNILNLKVKNRANDSVTLLMEEQSELIEKFEKILNCKDISEEQYKNDLSIKSLVQSANSLFKLIDSSDSVIKYSIEAEKKDNRLFKLNYDDPSKRFRFRVARDLDPIHFTIGAITNCCQRIGGAGEDAAIDSFINPLAGLLLLEVFNKRDDEWKIVSQSYFHFVPKDSGIILDNVEENIDNRYYLENNLELSLDKLYFAWAQFISHEGAIKYVRCGKSYNKLRSDMFKTTSIQKDPRYFKYDKYTDFSAANHLDLLNPKFKNKISFIDKDTKKAYTSERLIKISSLLLKTKQRDIAYEF